MDRKAHTELTLQAIERRESAVQVERVVMHDARHAQTRKAALIAARQAVARKRSLVSRILSFFKA